MSAELDVDDGTATACRAPSTWCRRGPMRWTPGARTSPAICRRSSRPHRCSVVHRRLRPLPGRHLRPVGGGRARLCRARARAPRGAAPADQGRSRGGARAARPLVRRRGVRSSCHGGSVRCSPPRPTRPRHAGRGRGRPVRRRRRRRAARSPMPNVLADAEDEGSAGRRGHAPMSRRCPPRRSGSSTRPSRRAARRVRRRGCDSKVRDRAARRRERPTRVRRAGRGGGGRRPAERPGTRSSGCWAPDGRSGGGRTPRRPRPGAPAPGRRGARASLLAEGEDPGAPAGHAPGPGQGPGTGSGPRAVTGRSTSSRRPVLDEFLDRLGAGRSLGRRDAAAVGETAADRPAPRHLRSGPGCGHDPGMRMRPPTGATVRARRTCCPGRGTRSRTTGRIRVLVGVVATSVNLSDLGDACADRPATRASAACDRAHGTSDRTSRAGAGLGDGVILRPGDEVYGDNLALMGGLRRVRSRRRTCARPQAAELTFPERRPSRRRCDRAAGHRRAPRPDRRVLINGAGGGSGSFATSTGQAARRARDRRRQRDRHRVHAVARRRRSSTRHEGLHLHKPYDLVLDLVALQSVFAYRRPRRGGRYPASVGRCEPSSACSRRAGLRPGAPASPGRRNLGSPRPRQGLRPCSRPWPYLSSRGDRLPVDRLRPSTTSARTSPTSAGGALREPRAAEHGRAHRRSTIPFTSLLAYSTVFGRDDGRQRHRLAHPDRGEVLGERVGAGSSTCLGRSAPSPRCPSSALGIVAYHRVGADVIKTSYKRRRTDRKVSRRARRGRARRAGCPPAGRDSPS